MLEMIESRKIEGVITTEVSRLNRETVACSILRNLCKKNNITLIALSENIDTSSAQDSSFFFHIWAARAQDESERISQRVHSNALARAKRGLYTGTSIFGYKPGSPVKGHLEINQEESIVVRLVFDKFCDGYSCTQIADYLNALGYRNHNLVHPSISWSPLSINRMLKNIVYIGKRKLGDEIIQGVWQPIITPEKFDEAQKKFAEKVKVRKNQAGTHNHLYILSGLIYCSFCGQRYRAASGTGKSGNEYFYYKHKTSKQEYCLTPKYIDAEILENMILQQISFLAKKEVLEKLIQDILQEQHREKILMYKQANYRLQMLINSTVIRASKILEAYSSLTPEQKTELAQPNLSILANQKKLFMEEKEALEKKMVDIKKSKLTSDRIAAIIGNLCDYLVNLDSQVIRKLVHFLVQKIEITQEGIICYFKI